MKTTRKNPSFLLSSTVLFFLLIACQSISKFQTEPDFTHGKTLTKITLDSLEFYTLKSELEYVNKCFDSNAEILENTTTSISKITQPDSSQRKIIKRKISPYLQNNTNKNQVISFQLCINPKGNVLLARPLSYTSKFKDEKLLKNIAKTMFDYEYAADIDAACLECGLYTYKVYSKVILN